MQQRRGHKRGGLSSSGLEPRRFRWAGLACWVGGLVLVGLYWLHPLAPPSVEDWAAPAVTALAFFLVGLGLFMAPWLWRQRWGLLALLWLGRIVAVVLLARAVYLLAIGVGWGVEIAGGLRLLMTGSHPLLLLKASLFSLVAAVVVRAAWLSAPFSLHVRPRST